MRHKLKEDIMAESESVPAAEHRRVFGGMSFSRLTAIPFTAPFRYLRCTWFRTFVAKRCATFRQSYEWIRLWHTLPVREWIAAAEHFRNADFRSALRYYNRGLSRKTTHVAADCARLDRAYCLYRLGELKAAAEGLRTLVEQGSKLRDVYLLLARIELTMGRSWSAIDVLKTYRGMNASDLQTELSLCWCYMLGEARAGDIERIRHRLHHLRTKVSLTDPNSILVDTALAHFEIHYGDEDYGDQLLVRVLASGSAPFEAVLLRGERWLDEGRFLQGREQLERAIQRMPQDPRPAA
ncbi:MAG: hypothetical protein IT290_12550, partial [Deltaproteobacteria bacterium]|nr:hypothetical protein [Deltaproteobacteria bacterium]